MKDLLRRYLLPFLLAAILYPYIRTLRVRIVDCKFQPVKRDRTRQYIYAHYHEDIPVVALHNAYQDICTMASRSKDGELISGVLSLLGFRMIRGSTHHFGKETIEQVKAGFQQGKDLAWAVDGPRGPRHKVKEGVCYLSQKLQKPIVPIVAWASKKWVFHKSWDQMWFPYPFSKAVIMVGPPMLPASSALEVEQVLARLKQKVLASIESLK